MAREARGDARPWVVQQLHRVGLGLGTALVAFVCTHLVSPWAAERLREELIPTAEVGSPKAQTAPQGLACEYALVARTKRLERASITVGPACTSGFVLTTGCRAGDPVCEAAAIGLIKQGETLAVDQGVTLEIDARRLLHIDGCTSACPTDVSLAWADGSAQIDQWVLAPVIGWGIVSATIMLLLAFLTYNPLWAWWRRRQCWRAFREAERLAWTTAARPGTPEELDDLRSLLEVHGRFLFKPDDLITMQEVARLVLVAARTPEAPEELDLDPRMVDVLRAEFLATADNSSLKFVEYCLAAVHVGSVGRSTANGDD